MDRTLAAIDVGTNTVLMLVARRHTDGSLTPIEEVYRTPRLGTGVDATGALHADAIARAIGVIEEYRAIAMTHSVERIIVCGTSAVRDASNRKEFVAEVLRRTGLSLEVLSGQEEAFWSFRGTMSGLEQTSRVLVLDIGGGSTELILGDAGGIANRCSLNIGAVRLTERCFRHDPPTPAEINEAGALIDNALDTARHLHDPEARLVAVAGTPTTLATLAQGLTTFSQKAVAGYTMRRPDIENLWDRLHCLAATQIRRLSEVLEGRADVITAGTLILRKVMDRFMFGTMIVSDRGLRYGLLLRGEPSLDPRP